MSATVAIIGTCDTKLEELIYLRDEVRKHNNNVGTLLVDVGRHDTKHEAIDIPRSHIVSHYDRELDSAEMSRAEYLKAMSLAASEALRDLHSQGRFSGIVSAGGSCGTSLAAAVMRSLPIGMPKMMVSTMASGDTGPIIGESDIALMYSVVDIAGLNYVLRDVLGNAGASIAGATLAYVERRERSADSSEKSGKKRVAITMFGVTTPGVTAIREYLESRYPVEVLVFHATGHGGRAMERLIRDGKIDAVIDLTTTEACDLVMGGIMSAGPERLDAALSAGIPCIVSLGALDTANFGAKASIPSEYSGRTQVEHNSLTTLVRSAPEDCEAIAQFMGRKLRGAACPHLTQLWLPRGGVSALSEPGGPFHDEEADGMLCDTLRAQLRGTAITVIEDEASINDPAFATRVAQAMVKLMGLS